MVEALLSYPIPSRILDNDRNTSIHVYRQLCLAERNIYIPFRLSVHFSRIQFKKKKKVQETDYFTGDGNMEEVTICVG